MNAQRIPALALNEAEGPTRATLEGVKQGLGRIPNLFGVMAQSPGTLAGYFAIDKAKQGSLFSKAFQEKIALAVAEENNCDYCLSAHTALAGMNGIADDEIIRNRTGQSEDAKTAAGLQFAQEVVRSKGVVSDASIDVLRSEGYSDGEIIEIVFNVVSNILTNYVNHIAGTEVDFPAVPDLETAVV